MRLEELSRDLPETGRSVQEAVANLTDDNRQESWEAIQRLARQVSSQTSDLFVIQSQIRAYLIELEPSQVESDTAISYALTNRLDLMNQQAAVVDAWRHVHVAENALRANVDVFSDTVVGTIPGSSSPLNFSSDATSTRVGLRFDSPLNRLAERNIYRAQQVDYQRARRAYIERRDTIVQAVRFDLRELDADRVNFEIARQSLIVAARQVELAEIQLRAPRPEGDSSSTQDALNALNSLLDAKNNLIAVWVSYETNRLRLLLDTEALQLDERGFPQDDDGPEFNQPEPIPAGPAEVIDE
jgi:outer membrane protein TolC